MKKILSFFILSLFFISCSSDDNFTEPRNNGFIELDYNGEKLLFGKKSYNGWVLMEDNRQDTIAFTYTSRIDLEGVDFYEIQMEVYLNKDNQVKDVKMNFAPVLNGSGYTYQYVSEDNPMVYKNIAFDGEWIKGEFEGYLYYHTVDDKNPVHLTNGKFHFPVKGLDIDWSQW